MQARLCSDLATYASVSGPNFASSAPSFTNISARERDAKGTTGSRSAGGQGVSALPFFLLILA